MIDVEEILRENKVTLECSGLGMGWDPFMHWGMSWKNGVILWPFVENEEKKARTASAMFVYLWLKGVDAGLAKDLACLWATKEE